MGERPVRGENTSGALLHLEATATQSRSFAELVAALNRLNALESALATAIARARVPAQEVRTLLRAQTPEQCENAPAFQFMREVFAQVGIPLGIEAVGRFALTFSVDASPYSRIFSGEGKKTCAFVSEALARFLATDLGIPADVDELACRNAGASRCRFAAGLEPLAVARGVLDPVDWSLLRNLAEGESDRGMDRESVMSAGEREFRTERLIGYGLVDAHGLVLPIGKSVAAAGSPPDEGFDPPWREVTRLTEAIASAASFAEALTEVAPKEPRRDDVADPGDAALAAECHSFAELLARASKGRSWE